MHNPLFELVCELRQHQALIELAIAHPEHGPFLCETFRCQIEPLLDEIEMVAKRLPKEAVAKTHPSA